MKLINSASKINANREYCEDACAVIHSCIESSLFLLTEEEGDYSHSITQLLLVAQKKANSICAPTNYLYQPLSLPETIGPRIHTVRTATNMSAFALAQAMGVPRSCVEAWEDGSTIPASDKILPLASLLRCDPLWLLGDGDGTEPPALLNGEQSPTKTSQSTDGNLILGDRIQIARENLDIAEAELARKLNTYSDHISDWECGITEPL